MVHHLYLRQLLVFSSSCQPALLDSETLFLHSLLISKCLKLFETSSSSSSLELQFDVTESNCVPRCSFAKWHSCNWVMSMVSELAGVNGPDRLAGVVWRAGDVLLNGVGHLEVVELPRGVISVPISLCFTSCAISAASLIDFLKVFPNRNPSCIGSEHPNLGIIGFNSFGNLSALAKNMSYMCVRKKWILNHWNIKLKSSTNKAGFPF